MTLVSMKYYDYSYFLHKPEHKQKFQNHWCCAGWILVLCFLLFEFFSYCKHVSHNGLSPLTCSTNPFCTLGITFRNFQDSVLIAQFCDDMGLVNTLSQLWPMAPIVTSTSTCAYNTLRLERNGHQFADAIFKRNLIDSHFKVNSLGFNWQWFSFGLGDGLVLLGTKPLPNRCWPGYMTPYDLSRPQCVTQNIVYASANRKLKCHPQYIYDMPVKFHSVCIHNEM